MDEPKPLNTLLQTLNQKRPRLPAFVLANRAAWTIRLIAGSLLFVKLFTLGLWRSDRLFPHAPVWKWLPAIPTPIDTLILLVELGVLLLILVRPERNRALPIFFALALAFVLTDQVRLQPWYYLYALLLVPALLYRKSESNTGVLVLMQIVVVGLYTWSGIHKHSHDYYNYVHGFIAQPLAAYLPEFLFTWVEQLGYAAPWIEMGSGLLLLLNATRNWAVLLITGMHAYLLLCLGPLGSGWNSVIWPWNVSMVLIVWTLFYDAQSIAWSSLARKSVRVAAVVLVPLALILPALRFANAWDNNLSFCLYSGKTRGLTLYVAEGRSTSCLRQSRNTSRLPTTLPQFATCH